MDKHWIWCLMTALALGSWTAGGSAAEAVSGTKKAEGEQKLTTVRDLSRKQQDEAKKVRDLIDQKKAEIGRMEQQIDQWDGKIADLNKELNAHQERLKAQEEKLKKMLSHLYVRGEHMYMIRLLESDSFDEFLHRVEVVRLIVNEEAEVLNEYVRIKNRLEETKSGLQEAQDKQRQLVEESKKAVADLQKTYDSHQSELDRLAMEEEKILRQYGQYIGYGSGRFQFPTSPGFVSWNFMQWRGSHYHKGVDMPRPPGTPIYAADSGVVRLIKADPGGYGIYIVIDHGGGLSTLYAHMYRYTVIVREGQYVRKGQKIAEVGNNGRSYGARGGYHLHFEVHKGSRTVNPKGYLR
jgi:murein DD-endopeptidase MepM/ murein hydrolase activator NlpD